MQEQYNLFFFNDTATTEIYTLSLHDALPICPPDPAHAIPRRRDGIPNGKTTGSTRGFGNRTGPTRPIPETASTTCRFSVRSEEHTSELQSRSDLVCRLLLEKKNNTLTITRSF